MKQRNQTEAWIQAQRKAGKLTSGQEDLARILLGGNIWKTWTPIFIYGIRTFSNRFLPLGTALSPEEAAERLAPRLADYPAVDSHVVTVYYQGFLQVTLAAKPLIQDSPRCLRDIRPGPNGPASEKVFRETIRRRGRWPRTRRDP